MRVGANLRVYISFISCKPIRLKETAYHNRGLPKRVILPDGSDFFSEPNLSPRDERCKLERLEKLEQKQLGNSKSLAARSKKRHGTL